LCADLKTGVIMARSKNGEAISKKGRNAAAKRRLRGFIKRRSKDGNLDEWRRGRAVISYIEGRRVTDIAADLDVTRGSVNRWLQWYEAMGLDGLVTTKPPGAEPKLSESQRAELISIIENGPQEAGYQTGVWAGPMVGDLIERKYGVTYHKHAIPRLLHSLGFSLQRPRKRLARADSDKQATWLRKTFPAIKKRPAAVAE
jgi:transposase